MENFQIVLASGSPRRRELLERIGLSFTVRPTDADETIPPGLTERETVEVLSRRKAEAAQAGAGELVLAADTMVFLDGLRLGKPKDAADALRMLTALQGRRHTVRTGVTLRRGDEYRTDSEVTAVYFRPAPEDLLRRYIATGEPMDKAGGYGLQTRGMLLVERIEGDFTNVIGLPVPLLSRMLEGFGVRVL